MTGLLSILGADLVTVMLLCATLLAGGLAGDGPIAALLAGVLIRHAALVLLLRAAWRAPLDFGQAGTAPERRAGATGSAAG